MTGEVIGQAWIDVLPRVDRFAPDMQRQVDSAFTKIRPTVDRAGRNIETSLGQGAKAGARHVGRETEAAAKNVKGTFAGIGTKIAAGFAAFQGVQAFKGIITDAAQASDAVNAIRVTLGTGANAFLKFGENAASSLGITQQALNQAVVPLAAGLKNAGLSGEELSSTLQGISTRANDVASVMGADLNEVLNATAAAVRGEFDPLERFGVSLRQAEVNTKAVSLGLAKSTTEVSANAKQQAVLALFMEKTSFAQGDFAKTADQGVNAQRRLAAATAEAKTAVGQALLPAVEKLIPALRSSAEFTQKNAGVIVPLTAALGGLAVAVYAVNAATKAVTATKAAYTTVTNLAAVTTLRQAAATVASRIAMIAVAAATKAWAAAQVILNLVLTANPIGIVIVAIAAFVAGIVIAYKRSETFRNIVKGAFDKVKEAGVGLKNVIVAAFQFLLNVWLTVAGGILRGAAKAFGWVPGVGPKLRGAVAEFDKMAKGINSKFDSIRGKHVTVTAGFGWTNKTFSVPGTRVRAAKEGGLLDGPGTTTSDSIPVLASRREFVQPAASTDYYGVPFMEAVRRRTLPRYATGGLVGDAGDQQGVRVTAHGSFGPLERGVRAMDRVLTQAANNLRRSLEANAISSRVGAVVKFAKAQLGEPYLWGGTGPNRWDCSGLMLKAFERAGIHLPRVARDQAHTGRAVSRSQSRLGDLMYFGVPAHHIGLALGNDRLLHAPHTGDVVKISSGRIGTGYRRVFDRGGTLLPGINVVENRTGRPEPVVPADRGGFSPTVNVGPITISGTNLTHGEIAQEIGQQVVHAFRAYHETYLKGHRT